MWTPLKHSRKAETWANYGKGDWKQTDPDVNTSVSVHTIKFKSWDWHDMLSSTQIALSLFYLHFWALAIMQSD